MTARLWKTFLLLGLVKLCACLIRPAPLEKRLCDADFVFKFKVTSNAKNYCLKIPRFNSKLPTTRPKLVLSPSTLPGTPRALSSIKTALTMPIQSSQDISPRNDVLRKATSSGRVNPHVPGVLTAPRVRHLRMSARWRRSSCFPVYYQDIQIIEKHVYKGLDGIKRMSAVNVTAGKHYYESRVKRDLNFGVKLNLNEKYLFVGKRIWKGKLEDHVFTANLYTVEQWTKAKHRLSNFNFDTKCKSS